MTNPVGPPLVEGKWQAVKCTSGRCGAWVVWATTAQGKGMPVDVEPSPTGNCRLEDGPTPVAPNVVVVPMIQRGRPGLRTSHFATCVAADEFRRKGKARKAANR